MKSIKISLLVVLLSLSAVPLPARADGTSSVYIEELTWMEIQSHLKQGKTTVIVPTGSTEQGGAQLVEGMHNEVVHYTAGEIAKKLGNALVAPVIPFAPTGRINPAEGHMQFSGTLTLSEHTYDDLLEDVVRSLKQHGFHIICLIAETPGAQRVQGMVAGRLSREWTTEGVKVVNVSDYYYKNGQEEWGDSIALKVSEHYSHAGHIETSELMSVDASGVRDNMLGVRTEHDYKTTGAMGDSTLASANYGRRYLSLKIEAAIKQIQNASSHAK